MSILAPTNMHPSRTFEYMDLIHDAKLPQYPVKPDRNAIPDLVNPSSDACFRDGEFLKLTATGLARVESEDITKLADQADGIRIAGNIFQVKGQPGRLDIQQSKMLPVFVDRPYRFRYKLVDTEATYSVETPCTLAIGSSTAGVPDGVVYLKPIAANESRVAFARVFKVNSDGWVEMQAVQPFWHPAT